MPAGAPRAALAGRVPLTAGALLHKTSTDLRKWLLAIWLLRRKITQAMRRGEHELLLRGVVELDESLLGGRGRAHLPANTRHAGSSLPTSDPSATSFSRSDLYDCQEGTPILRAVDPANTTN